MLLVDKWPLPMFPAPKAETCEVRHAIRITPQKRTGIEGLIEGILISVRTYKYVDSGGGIKQRMGIKGTWQCVGLEGSSFCFTAVCCGARVIANQRSAMPSALALRI